MSDPYLFSIEPMTAGELRARMTPPAGNLDLSADRRKISAEMVEEEVHRSLVANPAAPFDRAASDKYIISIKKALELLGGEPDEHTLTEEDVALAEAIIVIDGTRPAVYIQDDFVDTNDPKLVQGGWKDIITQNKDAVQHTIRASGRVIRRFNRSPDEVYGSAWMVAPGKVATAKHVVQSMANFHQGEWHLKSAFHVDFKVEAERTPNPTRVFKVKRVEWVSPDLLAGPFELSDLDVAVLELEPLDGVDFPEPLPLAKDGDTDPIFNSGLLVNVGHPASPTGSWIADVGTNIQGNKIPRALLNDLLGDQYGVKRLSPGRVRSEPGSLAGDLASKHVFSHEASTLGGSSGSAILGLGSPEKAIAGLHFAGQFRTANYAHWIPAIGDKLSPPNGGGIV